MLKFYNNYYLEKIQTNLENEQKSKKKIRNTTNQIKLNINVLKLYNEYLNSALHNNKKELICKLSSVSHELREAQVTNSKNIFNIALSSREQQHNQVTIKDKNCLPAVDLKEEKSYLNKLGSSTAKKYEDLLLEYNQFMKQNSLFDVYVSGYNNKVYRFNKKNQNSILNNFKVITNIITNYFNLTNSILISKPVLEIKPNQPLVDSVENRNKENIIIPIFFFESSASKHSRRDTTRVALFNTQSAQQELLLPKILTLISFLSKFMNKNIKLELIRLKYPYLNSEILAQILGKNANNKVYINLIQDLFNKVNVKNTTTESQTIGNDNINYATSPKSFVAGIKIRAAGRLMRQKIIPRLTVKVRQNGTLARGKTQFAEKARFTHKNKRGAYSFTVSISHIFV